MNLDLAVALLTVGLLITAALVNAYKIAKHQVEATLSSWLIFSASTSISFLSYLASSNKNFIAGALNGGDVTLDLIVIPSILFFGINRWKLKSFEKYYLFGIVLVCLFWLLTSDAFTSNLFIQGLLTIAYFPTYHTIIKFKRNTESFVVWGLILAASVVSMYLAVNSWQSSGDILSLVYSLRSIVLITVLMLLMFIYKSTQVANLRHE